MRSRISSMFALCLVLAVASTTSALPWPTCSPMPTPPAGCNSQYASGVMSGQALVWSSWLSRAVAQNCANWDLIKNVADVTIPTSVELWAIANKGVLDMTLYCRAQGLVDGAACELYVLPNCPQSCGLYTTDYAAIYDPLAATLDLSGAPLWFLAQSPDFTCGI